jgi:hypothetical protein
MLNATKADATTTAFSRQDPLPGQTTEGRGLLWWTGGDLERYIPLSEYGSQQRQRDLRAFSLLAPMIMIAQSVLVKKMQALQWSIESGRNKAIEWQRKLANLEQNRGWDTFIAKWARAYCESDYGGYAEVIRRAPGWAVDSNGQLTERGERAIQAGNDRTWTIVDAKVMDPTRCVPTSDPEFPLIFYNSWTGRKHYLRHYQFMHILDMPNVDDRIPGQGLCATSRAVYAAQEDRMTTRYGFEAISENPGTGMILANVNQSLLESALASADGQRASRGVVYYKGVIFLPVLDPSGNTKLEYLTFSHLPEGFNRTEDYSRIKEVVASAFGMDVLELGSIPGHNLGSGQQAVVAAAKARGKGIGALIQSVEREFRHNFLPPDVQLRIKKHDIDEQADRAELDGMYFEHATSMVQAGAWDAVLANQYLADKGAIRPEFPFMMADLTPSEELDDTEATESAMGPAQAQKGINAQLVRVDREGVVYAAAHPFVSYAQKGLSQKKAPLPDFEVQEELALRDMLGARRLWAKHMPKHSGLIEQSPPRPEPKPQRKGLLARISDRSSGAMPSGQTPVIVNVEPADAPEVIVKMEAPPIHVQATVQMPDETLETETFVARDPSTGRIARTTKHTQRI